MIKKIEYMLIILICAQISGAQNDTLKNGKLKVMQWYFNGSFGYYLPLENPTALADRGGFAGFNFEGVFKRRGFFNVAFDQGSINFETNVQSNGIYLNYKSRLRTTYITANVGYGLNSKKLQPYVYAGLGLATVDSPVLKIDNNTKSISFTSTNKNFFTYRLDVGIIYYLNKLFILYADVQYSSIPFKTDLANKQLNGITLQLGFKTPLSN